MKLLLNDHSRYYGPHTYTPILYNAAHTQYLSIFKYRRAISKVISWTLICTP